MNASGTVTTSLPLPPTPEVENPAAAPAPEGKTPYLPPELRATANPDISMLLPPLYGWKRIVLNDLKMPEDIKVVEGCGLQKDFIFDFFVRRLQEGRIPVMNRAAADRMVADAITVTATPTIISMQDMVINCTSWVQFQVTADVTMRIPPLMYRRTVPLLLWHDGMMVTSAKSTHNGALINAFIDLAMRFRDAWDKQQAMVDPKRILD